MLLYYLVVCAKYYPHTISQTLFGKVGHPATMPSTVNFFGLERTCYHAAKRTYWNIPAFK